MSDEEASMVAGELGDYYDELEDGGGEHSEGGEDPKEATPVKEKESKKRPSISAVVDQLEKIVKKQRPRECDLCNTVLKNGKDAESHRRAEHERGLYQCKKCGKGFQRSQGLLEHTRGVHDKVTFSCGKCGQIFGVKSNLKRHQKTDRACRGPREDMAIEYIPSEYLPEGWTFRGRKRGLDILTPEGFKLDSYVAISRYMLQKETYTKEQDHLR